MTVPRTPVAALLALGASATSVAASPPVAVAADPPMIEHCITFALPVEEVRAGAVNEVECWYEEEYTPVSMRGSSLMMVHWDYSFGSGTAYDVYGSGCTGLAVNFSGGYFDNRTTSTTHISCGNAKHYTGAFSGSNQLTSGGYGAVYNLNGTLNNAVSSVEYAP